MRLNVFVGLPGTYSILSPYLGGEYAIPHAPDDWTLKPEVIRNCPEKMFLIFNQRDRNSLGELSMEALISDIFFENTNYSEGLIGIDIKKVKGIKNIWEKSPSGTRFFFFKGSESQAAKIKEYSEILTDKPDRLARTMNRDTAMAHEDAVEFEGDLLSIFDTSDHANIGVNLGAIPWSNFDSNSFNGGSEPATSDVLVKIAVKP